jgi:hypothetical protein
MQSTLCTLKFMIGRACCEPYRQRDVRTVTIPCLFLLDIKDVTFCYLREQLHYLDPNCGFVMKLPRWANLITCTPKYIANT